MDLDLGGPGILALSSDRVVTGRDRLCGYQLGQALEGEVAVREGLSKRGDVVLEFEQILLHVIHLFYHSVHAPY
jgi:hypothetical protein